MIKEMNEYEKKEYIKNLKKNKAVKIYRKILKGDIKGFSKGFWDKRKNIEVDAMACVRYLIDVEMDFKKKTEDINKITKRFFKRKYLLVMLNRVFDGDLSRCMLSTYKGEFFEWEFNRKVNEYWNEELFLRIVKKQLEGQYSNREQFLKKYSYDFYKDNRLRGPVRKFYNNNIFEVVENLFPGEYQPWEFRCVGRNYWNEYTAKKATLWMLEKLDWSIDDIKNKLTKQVFKDYGLAGMLRVVYGDSPYSAAEALYPGKIKIWEMKNVPSGYWNIKTAKEAMRYIIEDKKGYNSKGIRNELSQKDLIDNGLEYIYYKYFEGDLYKVVKTLYGNKYKANDIKKYRPKPKVNNKIAMSIMYYD